jgi:hypothetical protein
MAYEAMFATQPFLVDEEEQWQSGNQVHWGQTKSQAT